MIWKTVAISVLGTSHLKTNTPCQDYSECRDLKKGNERYSLLALSDGAGSARFSDEGSRFAVSKWLNLAEEYLKNFGALNQSTMLELSERLTKAFLHYVEGKPGDIRDYACTLLTAIIYNDKAAFFQIGDGAWIFRTSTGYRCATWPYQGEYAGETVFLTSNQARQHYQITLVDEGVNAVAGFTDGIERLALKMASREAHPAFFESMFSSLELKDAVDIETDLKMFLNSPRINDRTDDDKTLVLSTRVITDDCS